MEVSNCIDDFTCGLCNYIFRNQGDLKYHLFEFHVDRQSTKSTKQILDKNEKHKCNTCDKKFISESLLKSHYKDIHKKSHKCDICGKSYEQIRNFNYHVKMNHADLPNLKCDICGKTYKEEQYLQKHIKVGNLKGYLFWLPFLKVFCQKWYFGRAKEISALAGI